MTAPAIEHRKTLDTKMLSAIYEEALRLHQGDILGLSGREDAWETILDHAIRERIHGQVSLDALSREMIETGYGIVLPAGSRLTLVPTMAEVDSTETHVPLGVIELMRAIAKEHLKDRVRTAIEAIDTTA